MHQVEVEWINHWCPRQTLLIWFLPEFWARMQMQQSATAHFKSTLLLMFAYSATGRIRRSGVDQAPNQVHECLQSFAVPLRIRLVMYPQAALRFHSNQAKYQMCNRFHLYTGQWMEMAPHSRLWQCDQDPVAPQRAWKWRREARRLAQTYFLLN